MQPRAIDEAKRLLTLAEEAAGRGFMSVSEAYKEIAEAYLNLVAIAGPDA